MAFGQSTLHVLDFDGVVCDGLEECALTAWITFNRPPKAKWTIETLRRIPVPFKARFRHARSFVRHDGHFLVPFTTDAAFTSASQFEAYYTTLPEPMRDDFRHRFRQVREHLREQHYDEWIALHSVYPQVVAALHRMADFHIVSGKDAASIRSILASSGVVVPGERIHGGQTEKVSVLLKLKEAAAASQQCLTFCDDNLTNVLEARAAGIPAVWAGWGYHTPDDIAEAGRRSVCSLGLPDVERFFRP